MKSLIVEAMKGREEDTSAKSKSANIREVNRLFDHFKIT